jgi:transcriptional regulator with XRE-family HTH domain
MNGEELKEIRLKLGLTQIQLAEKCDTSERHIRRLEKNEVKINKTMAFFFKQLEVFADNT